MEPMEALAVSTLRGCVCGSRCHAEAETDSGTRWQIRRGRRHSQGPGLQLIPLRNDLQAKRTQKRQPMGQKLK